MSWSYSIFYIQQRICKLFWARKPNFDSDLIVFLFVTCTYFVFLTAILTIKSEHRQKNTNTTIWMIEKSWIKNQINTKNFNRHHMFFRMFLISKFSTKMTQNSVVYIVTRKKNNSAKLTQKLTRTRESPSRSHNVFGQ